jgi:hypothetical protein
MKFQNEIFESEDFKKDLDFSVFFRVLNIDGDCLKTKGY